MREVDNTTTHDHSPCWDRYPSQSKHWVTLEILSVYTRPSMCVLYDTNTCVAASGQSLTPALSLPSSFEWSVGNQQVWFLCFASVRIFPCPGNFSCLLCLISIISLGYTFNSCQVVTGSLQTWVWDASFQKVESRCCAFFSCTPTSIPVSAPQTHSAGPTSMCWICYSPCLEWLLLLQTCL